MGGSKRFLVYCIGIILVVGILYFVIAGSLSPILLILLICPFLHLFMHRGHSH